MIRSRPIAPSLASWHGFTDAEIATRVARRGAGTTLGMDSMRRWFYFDYLAGDEAPAGLGGYIAAGARALAELLNLLLAHGLDPLFVPIQLPVNQGVEHVQMLLSSALPALLHHPQMAAVYYRARVRPYGPWPALPAELADAALAYAVLQSEFKALAARTATNRGPRLFWTVQFNADPVHPPPDSHPQAGLLQMAGAIQTELGRPPTHAELLAAYYHLDPGETLPLIRLLLSASLEYPAGLMVPPLLGGYEDLYFTVTSLLSLDRPQLRAILYDWLYLRPQPAEDYVQLAPADRIALATWYQAHRRQVIGLGVRHPQGDFWYPLAADAGDAMAPAADAMPHANGAFRRV